LDVEDPGRTVKIASMAQPPKDIRLKVRRAPGGKVVEIVVPV